MGLRRVLLVFFVFPACFQSFAQSAWLNEKLFKSPDRKKQLWIYWGYNRGQYTVSDITFTGPGYDFTLNDVRAKDRQSPFDAKVYFNPKMLSVPQFNVRTGFFLTDRFSISLGYDHMKYVAITDQIISISGTIDSSVSAQYAGTYNNVPVQFKSDLVRFEHTNGLNYVSVEGDYYGKLWRSGSGKQKLDFFIGGGLGVLYPRSDVDLFDVEGINIFHVAGWGVGIETGFRFDIIPNVFLNINVKGGFINMPDVLTLESGHKARHHFFFLQEMATIGYSVNFLNKKHLAQKSEVK